MPELDDLPDAQRPFFWKLAHVAPSMGLTPDMLLAAIDAGQVPIRAERFGARGQVYLARADVMRYLNSFLHPAEGTV